MMIDLKTKEKSKAAFKNARRALVADVHTFSSIFMGYDEETGRPQFDTKRPPMGEFVYKLKSCYTQDATVIPKIVDLLEKENEFIDLINDIDFIVPIPPSKKNRAVQPTIAVAEEISKRFGKPTKKDFIISSNTDQVKAIDSTERYDVVKKGLSLTPDVIFNRNAKILLFDDVLDTASTIKAIIDTLISEAYTDISVLMLTITRKSGLE